MLGGRVKTLHPRIHGGDPGPPRPRGRHGVAAPSTASSRSTSWSSTCTRSGTSPRAAESTEAEVIEKIDVGGPGDGARRGQELRRGGRGDRPGALRLRAGRAAHERRATCRDETRRELAAEAFAHTAGYDVAIANWFSETESFPERIVLELVKVADLPYGENPHQRAAYYVEAGARRHLLSMVEQLGGKQLSFNNLLDLDAARSIVAAFSCRPASSSSTQPLRRGGRRHASRRPTSAALDCRPGVGVRRRHRRQPAGLDASSPSCWPSSSCEVLFAPGYEPEAVEVLRQKPHAADPRDRRAAQANPGRARPAPRAGRRADAGPRHRVRGPRHDGGGDGGGAERARVGRPAVRLAGRQARALERDRDRPRPGHRRHRRRADVSRVDAVRLALEKAGGRNQGAVLASDAFFPFDDGPRTAVDGGRARDHPAGRLEARRRGHRGRRRGRRSRWSSPGRRHFLH